MRPIKVLVGCEYSQRVCGAFRQAGYEAFSCDLLPTEGNPEWHYQGDVRDILSWDVQWDLFVAHPDCTYLTNSGVRWMTPERKRKMREAVAFYKELWNADVEHICIENPVMHGYANELLVELPKRQFVQPWWFGDRMFKRTGYTLKNLPRLEPTNKLVPPAPGTEEHKEWSWVHRCPPGPNRWKIRSRTPQGIANAMAQQWGSFVQGVH